MTDDVTDVTDHEIRGRVTALLREAIDRLSESPDNERFVRRCLDYLDSLGTAPQPSPPRQRM